MMRRSRVDSTLESNSAKKVRRGLTGTHPDATVYATVRFPELRSFVETEPEFVEQFEEEKSRISGSDVSTKNVLDFQALNVRGDRNQLLYSYSVFMNPSLLASLGRQCSDYARNLRRRIQDMARRGAIPRDTLVVKEGDRGYDEQVIVGLKMEAEDFDANVAKIYSSRVRNYSSRKSKVLDIDDTFVCRYMAVIINKRTAIHQWFDDGWVRKEYDENGVARVIDTTATFSVMPVETHPVQLVMYTLEGKTHYCPLMLWRQMPLALEPKDEE